MLSKKLTRLIANAASNAATIGSPSTDLVHVLLAMCDDPEACADLRERGADPEKLRRLLAVHLSERIPSPPPSGTMTLSPLVVLVLERAMTKSLTAETVEVLREIWDVEFEEQEDCFAAKALRTISAPPGAREARVIPETLAKHCVDLVESAFSGGVDPVFGREEEVGRIVEVLSRRKKNNPILVGGPGVGKTAIVEGLALRIAKGEAGARLNGCRILSLNVASLVGGTRNRGDLEERLVSVVRELSADPSLILFIDEAHVLLGGATGSGEAANLLKPALASGAVRCIAATTEGEYARYFEADPAMARRFQMVAVAEPTRNRAVEIVSRLVDVYSAHHGVPYGEGVAEAAVDLSLRFIVDRRLPDKAIDAIDEAGAVAAARGLACVDRNLMRQVVMRLSGMEAAVESFESLEARLGTELKGQAQACASIAKALARSLAAGGREGRARCSMVLSGPDGSGKRFAASAVARLLGQPLRRLDMAEFREPHTVARLIGSPPGYVGFGAGGQLTEPVRHSPSCVFLLDRIDLAHPDVLALVMQAVETGELADSAGKTASFAGVTILMTVAPQAGPGRIGFARADDAETAAVPPGLAEAVDETVSFKGLDMAAMEEIAKAHIATLEASLEVRGANLVAGAEVAAAVAAEAVKAAGGGGRAVERAFRSLIENGILDSNPEDGDEFRISPEGDGLRVERAAASR